MDIVGKTSTPRGPTAVGRNQVQDGQNRIPKSRAMMTTDADTIGQPHYKPYMPGRLGRVLERASYRDLALLALLVWLCAALYFVFVPDHHGIVRNEKATHDFLDSVYFVLVTLTSLGYGDYAPVGLGRLVASFLVLYGISTVALFVGKLASERSQAMIMLLHTSDRDRRLRGFSDAIEETTRSLKAAIAESNLASVGSSLRALTGMLEGTANYVAFHGHHSGLGNFGNTPALLLLCGRLRCLTSVLLEAMTQSAIDSDVEQRLDANVRRVVGLVTLIVKMHSTQSVSDWTEILLVRLRLAAPSAPASKALLRHRVNLLDMVEIGRKRASTVLTVGLANRVLERCLPGPLQAWPPHEHKRIASELEISNNMATRAIADLKTRGRLPRQ